MEQPALQCSARSDSMWRKVTLCSYNKVDKGRPAYARRCLPDSCRQGDASPAHMTITVYPELVEQKGVALVRGDVVSESIINPQEVGRGTSSFALLLWPPNTLQSRWPSWVPSLAP